MALKDIYENWTFKPLAGVGSIATPKNQAEGKVAVDFLPNTYQKNDANRVPGDTVVTQATSDDSTNGVFKPDTAFKYYSTLIQQYGTLSQTYKAQVSDTSTFVGSNSWKNSPGVLYSTNS